MNRLAISLRPINAHARGSFQIALHVFHAVLFQEHLHFFLERDLSMMLGLTLNVFRRVLDAGDTDAESPVAFLSLEVPLLLEGVVNPFGRVAFEKLNRFCDR